MRSPTESCAKLRSVRSPTFPEIKGRVSALPDGRLGRFGWKGQMASLDDFVRAACSNELGLEVPGHHQVSLATAKEFDPSRLKLDMDEDQCDLLTRFVSRLAPPVQRPADDGTAAPVGIHGVSVDRLRDLPRAEAGRR